MKWFMLLLSVLVLSACGSTSYKPVQVKDGAIQLPLDDLQPMQAAFYEARLEGKVIRFFAVRDGNGVVRTALDACDVCYKDRKGYQQQDDRMICRTCGLGFPITRIGPYSIGGCNPHYLASRSAGDLLVISVGDLREGVRFFP